MAQWQQVKEIVGDALELAPDNRALFLDKACANDEPLRREVESLLASSENVSGFMEQAAIGKVAEMFDDATGNKGQISGRFNHYEIIKQIGAGGMGEVYLALDKKLDRRVAVKILNERFSREEANLNRFIQEAKAASGLNHPNILVIHEIGECEDAHYIVSEYIEGETLREIFKERTLMLAEILDISTQIANALAAAHKAHIVHRDIKPENIIVRPDGYVKLLDFGLAKLVVQQNSFINLEGATAKQNETAKGVIMGTVNYMSPEQAKGEKVDERTDIFSLGVVIYEMIAGRTPFAADSMSETFANLINKEPLPLSHFVPDVPKELERIVLKSLKKDKDVRYQTMKGLLADLKEFRENLTLEKKLERLPTLPEENKTVALPTKTDDLNKQTKITKEFGRRILTRRSVIYGSVLLILLAAATTFFWRWRQNTIALQPTEIKSLAVLPLKSLDNGENYLGLGIADAVIRRISQTGELTVRPTSAVRHYLNEDTDALTAAKQLNTDAVLEGNIQKADNRLRVSVNLLRTADGASMWSDSFDLPATDVFTIQDKVSQQVASHLQLQLAPEQKARLKKPSTSNPVAYDYYLRGIYAFDQSGYFANTKPQLETAIDFFKEAIEADPNFALAHAKLGYALAWMGVFMEPAQQSAWAKQAEEEINKSQELDSQLAETHEARSLLFFSAYGGNQNEAAIRELLLAQQLNPNVGHDGLAVNYQHIGLEDLAERELQRAIEVDPTSESVKLQIFNLPLLIGNYDGWFTACQKYTPDNCNNSPWYLMGKNRLDEAQKAIEEQTAKNPNSLGLPQDTALLYALKGNFRAAEAEIPAILEKTPHAHPLYHHATYAIACVYALEGKSVEAVKWLRETAATGFPCYPLFERDAYLNRIRQSPEFVKFMAEQKAQNERFRSEFQ